MDANVIIELLKHITIGDVIIMVGFLGGIFGAVSALAIKLYKVFLKYMSVKNENEKMKSTVANHENELKAIDKKLDTFVDNISKQLAEIKSELDDHRGTKIAELRHSISVAGENALASGEISVRQWTSLHEMYDLYENKYHQNSYIKSLMQKVDREVKVIGKIDEHGTDIG